MISMAINVFGQTQYQLVTSADQLVAGAKYIIANSADDDDAYVISTEAYENNRKTISTTISNGIITLKESMMVFELGGSINAWTFKTTNYKGTDGYLYTDDTKSNKLLVLKSPSSSQMYHKFNITIENNKITSIANSGNKQTGEMYFYNTYKIFSCYTKKTTSDYDVPQLFKEIENSSYGKYKVIRSVNGQMVTTEVTTNSSIDFSAPSNVPGYVFKGWTTNQFFDITKEPEYVTSATAQSDVTYYAVFVSKTYKPETLTKITNKDDITDGSYAILSYDGLYYLPNNSTSTNAEMKSTQQSNGVITVTDDMKWNLETAYNGRYILKSSVDAVSYLWGGTSSSSTYVSKDKKTNSTNEWFAESNGDYGVILYVGDSSNKMYLATFNDSYWKTSNSLSTTNKPANLYTVNEGSNLYYYTIIPAKISISNIGYSTYYNSKYAYKMPDDCAGYTAKFQDGSVILNEAYQSGSVVPAGEALIIHSKVAGGKTLYFTSTSESKSSDNDLLGTDESLKPEDDDACYFYALTLNSSGDASSLGFYWRADGGVAFENGAHKAYLKIKKSAFAESGESTGAKAKLLIFADDETDIHFAETTSSCDETIYSITGSRQQSLSKGLNIVKRNGKMVKVYVK